jgi:hypothetical protein
VEETEGNVITDAQIKALEEETAVLSAPSMIRATSSYQDILKQGDDAIDDLMAALREKRVQIPVMLLLHEITGENPVDREDAGNVDKMRKAWLQWSNE